VARPRALQGLPEGDEADGGALFSLGVELAELVDDDRAETSEASSVRLLATLPLTL